MAHSDALRKGDLANTRISSNVEDHVRAADHLRTRFGTPALLIARNRCGAEGFKLVP